MKRKKIRPLSIVYSIMFVCMTLYITGLFSDCAPIQNTSSTSRNEQYLGDISCASCHAKEYRDWQGSHHDLAMQMATDTTVLGNFETAILESNGVKSTFFKKDGKFFVNTEDGDGAYQDFEVLYTFGVAPLQQYMVALPGGRLQCLLTAWDTVEKRWFDLMPDERQQADDWLHWTGGSMTWNTMCADCHSTNLEKNFDKESNSYDTQWSIIDVSCEACHGPGQQHLAYVNSSDFKNGEKIPGGYLRLTADTDSKQQVQECGRCHARRGPISEVFDHSGVMMDHYIPEILRPGMYHADGQILEEVYVYGSFLQSKMYRNEVKCTDCHDAHTLELKFLDNELCTQCHQKDNYDTRAHHFHSDGLKGVTCIDCHMPGKVYMGNDFRRDHSFRVPRPDLSTQYGTPNACNNCHDQQPSEWAADAVKNWYGPHRKEHFADVLVPAQNGDLRVLPELIAMVGDTSRPEIAQATAIWLLKQVNPQQPDSAVVNALQHQNPMIRFQAVSAMEYIPTEDKLRYLAPLLKDSVKAIRTQTAFILADVPERLLSEDQLETHHSASQEYLDLLDMQADFPAGQMQRGQYQEKKNNLVAAEKAYREALRQDPYLAHAHFNLANLYYQQQQLSKAEHAFQEVIRLQPDAPEAYYSLGLLQVEMQNLQGAEPLLEKAATLSGNPRHFYNWGLVLQNLKQPDEAEKAYKTGLEMDPQSEALTYALAILYMQQNRPQDALPFVTLLLTINPDNPDYRNLMQALQ